MRKKSHISLARYMVERLEDEELRKHKLSFYIGSILPDIKPSFVYKRHEITQTFPALEKHIKRLSEGNKAVKKKSRKYYMDLGQISHYLADYFTFPHNVSYTGSLKDHCSYEEKLKKDLKTYLSSTEARHQMWKEEYFHNAEALCGYIRSAHEDYAARKHDVADDIEHIIAVNYKALQGMMQVLAENREAWILKHS